jgi:hypothetical protein
MANFLYNKGSISFSRKVIISDALVKNDDTDTIIEQPAGSVATKVYARYITAPDVGSSGTIGLTLGTGSAGSTELLADASANNLKAANASQPAAGAIVTANLPALTAVGQNAPAAAAAFTTDDRNIQVRVKMSNHTVTKNCDLEITIFFDQIA